MIELTDLKTGEIRDFDSARIVGLTEFGQAAIQNVLQITGEIATIVGSDFRYREDSGEHKLYTVRESRETVYNAAMLERRAHQRSSLPVAAARPRAFI